MLVVVAGRYPRPQPAALWVVRGSCWREKRRWREKKRGRGRKRRREERGRVGRETGH